MAQDVTMLRKKKAVLWYQFLVVDQVSHSGTGIKVISLDREVLSLQHALYPSILCFHL